MQDNTTYIQWCDNQLKGLQNDADQIGYKIDEDLSYQEVCEQITHIQFEEIEADTITWISIAYLIGVIRMRINQKMEMG